MNDIVKPDNVSVCSSDRFLGSNCNRVLPFSTGCLLGILYFNPSHDQMLSLMIMKKTWKMMYLLWENLCFCGAPFCDHLDSDAVEKNSDFSPLHSCWDWKSLNPDFWMLLGAIAMHVEPIQGVILPIFIYFFSPKEKRRKQPTPTEPSTSLDCRILGQNLLSMVINLLHLEDSK